MLLLLVLALTLSLAPGIAWANSGPPRYQGDTGGLLLPGKSDQVHVLRERLLFELQPELRSATVTARYQMVNRGDGLLAQPFVFLIQSSGSGELQFTASWNGQPLKATELPAYQLSPAEQEEMERSWTAVDSYIDPVTDEPYGQEDFFGRVGLRYFQFVVDLPAHAEGELQVTYQHVAAYDRVRYVHRVYHYQYLLLPARGWASFGPLEIEVSAPEGTPYFFASNLPFERGEGGYRAQFAGLPEENLAFSVMSRAGVVGNLVKSRVPYYWMGFGLLLPVAAGLGYLLGWLGSRGPRTGWLRLLAMAGLLLVGATLDLLLTTWLLPRFPTLLEDRIGMLFTGALQGLVAALVTAVITLKVAARGLRRG